MKKIQILNRIFPLIDNRYSWLLPDKVGEYCSKEEFVNHRGVELSQWIHYEQNVQSMPRGRWNIII